MTPYWTGTNTELWLGDCREVLPNLPMADVCVTDPPFAPETHTGARSNRTGADVSQIDFASMTVEELRSVFGLVGERTTRWVVATVDWRHCTGLESMPPAWLRFVRFGVWTKIAPMPQISADRPATGWEAVAILHHEGGKMRWNGGGKPAVWNFRAEMEGNYPTQKPLRLVQEFVRLFSEPGETILDPFCGSGTTAVAARNLGRKFVGIDQREAALELAVKRLSQEVLPIFS